MSHRLAMPTFVFTTFAAVLSAACPSAAAPSTSRGLISVAQVMEMLEKAPTDKTAHQLLVAYLAGVGEAAGTVVGMGGAPCRTSFGVSDANVRQAIKAAAGKDTTEIAATPLIVRDMLERAGCARP